MSRIEFSIGMQDRLWVVLPSFRPGSSSVRRGKAKLRVAGLECSVDVDVELAALERFFEQVRRCHDSLRGRFRLESPSRSLSVEGKMAPHGHCRVEVSLDRSLFKQRDDPQWQVSARFSCPADSLPRGESL